MFAILSGIDFADLKEEEKYQPDRAKFFLKLLSLAMPKKGEVAAKFTPVKDVPIHYTSFVKAAESLFEEEILPRVLDELNTLEDTFIAKHKQKQVDLDDALTCAMSHWNEERAAEQRHAEAEAALALQTLFRKNMATSKCLHIIKQKRDRYERKLLLELFNQHDSDGDGVMNYEEFHIMIGIIDKNLTDRHVVELYEQGLDIAVRKKHAKDAPSKPQVDDEDDDDDDDDAAVIDADGKWVV
jgi:hypothetical protein